MPRSARIYCPDGIFHIISRCHAQEYLLDGTEERRRYLGLVARSQARTDARVLAWCIMSNHAHLVVQAGREPLSRLTKPINSGYAVWKNRKEGRIGAVFADRPKTLLVETEPYLLDLVRYVHLNPVRAGLVARPEESDWSSHQCYLGHVEPPPWLNTELVMNYFPSGPRRGPKAFARFVDEALGEGRRPELSGELSKEASRELRHALGPGVQVSDPILGSSEFIQEVTSEENVPEDRRFTAQLAGVERELERTPGLRELLAAACVALDVDEGTFHEFPKRRGPRLARQVMTWLWVKQFNRPQVEISRYLKVGRDQVAHWYARAIDSFDLLEPTIRKVYAMFPTEEPDLAAGDPASLFVNVKVLKD